MTNGWLNGTPLDADIGWYWVNVTVEDGSYNKDSHNFTLWVYPVNDPPIITNLAFDDQCFRLAEHTSVHR